MAVAHNVAARSSRVQTERTQISTDAFARAILELSAGTEPVSVLVYGDSNAGKTVLAGTTPGRTFWLIGEPGYKSAARQGATGQGCKIGDTAMAWAAIDYLREKRRYKKFDWLVVDGASTLENRFRLSYAQEAFDRDPSKRAHRNLPDRPDYFNTQNMVKTWMAALVDLPVNLLVTAHAYRTSEVEDGELLVFPGFQGKGTEVSNAISGLMDVTGYLEARSVKSKKTGKSRVRRRLHFAQPEDRPAIRYIVGDKLNCLPPYIDGATLPAIMQYVDGNGGE